jgi:formylglycine-generating enzyme required for sulfatase activity/predicted esterase
VDGQRLDDWLAAGARDWKQVLDTLLEAGAGIAAAHAAGLVHRDIKPSNILLEAGAGGGVKITDFGLARAADDASLTRSGVIAGTPMYMSPEQATGGKIDHRADLFSLGSVLYVMCSGRPPFRASTTMGVLKRVAEDSPRPIPEIIPEVPGWLCAVVARLHAKGPEDRFASAAEVAALLTRCLAELQEHGRVTNAAQPLGPTDSVAVPRGVEQQPPVKRPTRWRTRLVASGVALALAVGAGVYFRPGEGDSGGSPDRAAAPPGAPPQQHAPDAAPDAGPTAARARQEACAKGLGVPVEFSNSVGMRLTLVPAGRFMMGSPEGAGRNEDEGPLHEVTITRPFYAGAYPVTFGQFRAFVTDTNYRTDAEKNRGSYALYPTGVKLDPKVNWRTPNFEQTDDHPVVCVSWNDARAYCVWLSGKEGRPYALPTEAQWEYACRADSRTKYFFGDDAGGLNEVAWYEENADSKTHPVGLKRPNPWGLYDVHGHVWQWTGDWYAPDYYKRSLRDDPPGPVLGKCPAQRGGSWMQAPSDCRSASRRGPAFATASASGTTIGFRVVLNGDIRSAPDPTKPQPTPAVEGKTGFLERAYRDAGGAEHPYALFVPHDYRGDREYPVILFLHGAGEIKGRGAPPVEVGLGPAIKKREGTFPFIAVFPQATRQSWQAGSPDAARALAILDAVCAEYKTDKGRVYLTGLSLGGYGTWSLAAANPERWAAIAPLCAGGDPKDAAKLKGVPCWCFHGDADRTVPVRGSRDMVAALRAAGGDPRYTEYPGVGHQCWNQAYGSPELYEFLLANSKK